MDYINVLIMAAGLGKRMKSHQAKVLHELAGRSMISHVCQTALSLSPKNLFIIVGHQAEEVSTEIYKGINSSVFKESSEQILKTILQSEQLGTGHAVSIAEPYFREKKGLLLVLSGDVPLVQTETLFSLIKKHRESNSTATILTTNILNPAGYGRIIRDKNQIFERIVEHKDATVEELKISEINSGIYVFKIEYLFPALKQLSPNNAQGEYYLTDIFSILKNSSHSIEILPHSDSEEILGINSRVELASSAARLRKNKLQNLMSEGVTIIDPTNTYIDEDTQIGIDTTIYPNVFLKGKTIIGERCHIGPSSHLVNAKIGNDVTIRDFSLIFDSVLHDKTTIGPFAHLRLNSEICEEATVGNFVEVKKSKIGLKSKAMHLSYLGDATIGERVNIGAGTITCNYDGKHKHNTVIEDGVKIGSNTMLVAPMRVGKNSITGAGSVVLKDVPENSLVVGVPAKIKKLHEG